MNAPRCDDVAKFVAMSRLLSHKRVRLNKVSTTERQSRDQERIKDGRVESVLNRRETSSLLSDGNDVAVDKKARVRDE